MIFPGQSSFFDDTTIPHIALAPFRFSGDGVLGMDGAIRAYALALAFFIRVAFACFVAALLSV
jgi:hypothetical protein